MKERQEGGGRNERAGRREQEGAIYEWQGSRYKNTVRKVLADFAVFE